MSKRKAKRRSKRGVAMLDALSSEHRERLGKCVDALACLPHGPGLVGFIAIHPTEPAGATWLPTEAALEVLADIDRGARWTDMLRTWDVAASPVVAVLPTTEAVLFAMLDGGGFGSMTAGGEA